MKGKGRKQSKNEGYKRQVKRQDARQKKGQKDKGKVNTGNTRALQRMEKPKEKRAAQEKPRQ